MRVCEGGWVWVLGEKDPPWMRDSKGMEGKEAR